MKNAEKTKLRDKRACFCEEYLVDLNATQAAIRCGYSRETAKQQGQRLLTNVDIQERVSELKDIRLERLKLTQDGVLTELEDTRKRALESKQYNAAIRASELKGKHLGMFVDRLKVGKDDPPQEIILKITDEKGDTIPLDELRGDVMERLAWPEDLEKSKNADGCMRCSCIYPFQPCRGPGVITEKYGEIEIKVVVPQSQEIDKNRSNN